MATTRTYTAQLPAGFDALCTCGRPATVRLLHERRVKGLIGALSVETEYLCDACVKARAVASDV